MTEETITAPKLVAVAGALLFGPNWQNPLADLIGMNQRNLRRIAQAARESRDYPVSPSLLAELEAHLRTRATASGEAANALRAYLAAKA